MKSIIKYIYKIYILGLMAVLICFSSMTALAAADSPSLDWTKDGDSSITVTLTDSSGVPVAGGELTLYQVASLVLDDGNMTYVYMDDFQNCGIDLDALTHDSTDASDLAASSSKLAAFAESAGLSGTVLSNASGTVKFSGLNLGLYLVVQTQAADNYTTLDPFVVTLPLADEETDAWIYDIDASPKMGTVTYVPEPETPEEPGTPDEPVEEVPAETAEPETVTLAQTGQLNWPIPLLCAAGVLCVLTGIGLMAGDSRRKRADAA